MIVTYSGKAKYFLSEMIKQSLGNVYIVSISEYSLC